MGSNKVRRTAGTILAYALALIYVMPVLITLINSFASPAEVTANVAAKSAMLFPQSFTLVQYYDLLVEKARYIGMFWNSILYSVSITGMNVLISILTAYIFAKYRFKGRNTLFFIYVIIMMMPFQVTLLPNYLISRFTGILDTRWAVILPGIFSPFGTFLLTQFFRYIPDEAIEAVRLESKSIWSIFKTAVLPSAKPGIIALAVIGFAENWNMVEQPIILISDKLKRPLSAVFNSIVREGADVAFAGSFFYMIPVIILCLYFEEHIVNGLSEWIRVMRK